MAGNSGLACAGEKLNDQISIRLDAFRALAALSVFCSHFAQLGMAGGVHEDFWALGRLGVIGFFVMSGYVIAYVAEYKHPTLVDYLEARFARLYRSGPTNLNSQTRMDKCGVAI
jgi:peptidoglycan/LPS O-acetylase OafA/YrhL